MSATDTLKTILTLEQNVAVPAKVAAEAVEELGQEASQAERRIDELGDEMTQTGLIAKMFGDSFLQAGGNPMSSLARSAATVGTSLGSNLAPMLSQVSTLLASPAGLAGSAVTAAGAFGALGFAVGSIGSALAEVGRIATAIGPSVAQGVGMSLAMPIMGAAKKRDTDTRMFTSFLGGEAPAKQMMGFLEQYGERSGLDEESLIAFTKTLAFQKQDVNKFLPTLETLSIPGGGNAESSQRVAEIWRRMMGGQVTEALGSEGFGSLGITKEMMIGAGAQFDKRGGFIGTPEDAAEMLKTLTETNDVMKDLRKNFEESIQTVESNFYDSVNKNFRLFAEEVSKGAIPILKQFTEGLKDMAESGVPEKLGKIFKDIFGLNGELKAGFNEIAAGFLSTVVTTLEIAKNGVNFILGALGSIDPFLDKVQAGLMASNNPVAQFAGAGLAGGRAAFAGFKAYVSNTVIGDDANANWKKNYDGFLEMLNEGTEKRKNKEKALAPQPDPAKEQQAKDQKEATVHLASINRNTQILAEASIQRMILGGGEIGSFGVTPYRVAVAQGRSTGSPVERAIRGLADALAEDQAIRLMSYDNAIQGRA